MIRQISENSEFEIISPGALHAYKAPDALQYSRQKSLHLVSDNNEESEPLRDSRNLSLNVGLFDMPGHVAKAWKFFFSKRLAIALLGSQVSNRLPFYQRSRRLLSLFPGSTVIAPGDTYATRYKGSLAFEQFLALFDYDQGAPHQSAEAVTIRKYRVDQSAFWPWVEIEKPDLLFAACQFNLDFAPPGNIGRLSALEGQKSGDQLLQQLRAELVASLSDNSPELTCLRLVHQAWTSTRPPTYSKFAVSVVNSLLRQFRSRLNNDNILPFLFELEAFASYESYVSLIAPFASGEYSNTWLDVGSMPLSDIRSTELCVRERLIEELFNLPTRGFAPVVVNEFNSVSDGNHRVTASWIWNILKNCQDTAWSVDDDQFLAQVRTYINRHKEAMGSVSLYESLKQLASFLCDPAIAGRLEHQLKPLVKSMGMVRKLPVVMLPEYCAGTVDKEAHDRCGLLLRVTPKLYEDLAQTGDCVLTPRASYHFTDAVLMPWFRVVKQPQRFQESLDSPEVGDKGLAQTHEAVCAALA